MYQIHKWEKKANQLFKNLSSLCYDLSYLSSCLSVHAKILGGEKNDPCLSRSPIFLLYNTQSVDLIPAEELVQGQADAHPVVMALCVVSGPLVEQAGSVPLESTLKLSGILLCLFIPWICFKRQAFYLVTEAHVFRARLHQQLIQTALIFSAPI